MAFVSGVVGMGNTNTATSAQPALPLVASFRSQDGSTESPLPLQQLGTNGTPMQPHNNFLYQQLLSGAVAQSQLLQVVAPQNQMHQTASSQPQQQQSAFVLANALAVAQSQIALNQLLLQNPQQQQQVQVLAQILNPALAYYQQLAALLQQSQFSQLGHTPQTLGQVPNGLNVSSQPQQKTVESLLVEQVVRNVTHDRICQPGVSQQISLDNRGLGQLTSPESVQEHITRLITENQAILEQNPGVLKRRPYHRQIGPQSSVEMESGIRSQSNSPGIREQRSTSVRSQAFYEPQPITSVRSAVGGSLTNGQPILRLPEKCHICNYCQLKFPNEAGLDAHELRCIRRTEIVHPQPQIPSTQSSTIHSNNFQSFEVISRKPSSSAHPSVVLENRHPLKKRLLAAVEQQGMDSQPTTSKVAKIEQRKTERDEVAIQSNLNFSRSLSHQNSIVVTINQKFPPLPAVSYRNRAASFLSETESIRRSQQTSICLQVTTAVDTEKPYILTLNDASAIRNDVFPRRSRMRNITTETFACLNRPRPMFVEHKGMISMYSNWQQAPVNPEEAKLNLLYMGMCSSKPRIGVKQFCRYTTAAREMGLLKVTHSSFWDYSTKMRLRQNAAVAACSQAIASNMLQPNIGTIDISPSYPRCSVSDVEMRSIKMSASAVSSNTEVTKMDTTVPVTTIDSHENAKNQDTVGNKQQARQHLSNTATLRRHIVGGYRTDEVYVYVKGRGRGRYVCDRCGIRCKKPSMLKKHIKSHTDIRPFKCTQCNFSFKTKGNLTKHLQSKAHRRKLAETQNNVSGEQESDSDHDRLEIASSPASNYSNDLLSDDECSSDDELRDRVGCAVTEAAMYRKFGQENILIERSTHTPPTLWMIGEMKPRWPEPDRSRLCHSAPPSTHYSFEIRRKRKAVDSSTVSNKIRPDDSGDDSETTRRFRGVKLPSVAQEEHISVGEDSGTVSQASATSQSFIGSFLAREEMSCDMCNRTFRKATELSLHRHTHFLEQQNTRTRSYQCAECRQNFRSRSLLNRHTESVHTNCERRHLDAADSDADECASSFSQTINPRSFVCSDCNIGFRKHGILAKHLRSKTHVMKLESLGKLPDDALVLITRKENGSCLNEVDTADCDRARASLLAIVNTLRDTNSLECREQMLQSPAPPCSVGGFIGAARKRSPAPCTSMANSNKNSLSPGHSSRKRSERNSAFTKQPETGARISSDSGSSSSTKKFDEVPAKLVSANVWMPPKPEFPSPCDRRSVDLALPSRIAADSSTLSDNGSSIRSDEAVSEGAGRSESSTPTHRPIAGTAPSPLLPTTTRCNLCDFNYESSFDLQVSHKVHLHADHVVMRDGKDFRCPKKQCDKVYPNRENLRLHIAAHYHGGGATPTQDGRDDIEGALTILSDLNVDTAATLHPKLIGTHSTQHANSAPNHSPGVPEESHTLSCRKHLADSPLSNSEGNADSSQFSGGEAEKLDVWLPSKSDDPVNPDESTPQPFQNLSPPVRSQLVSHQSGQVSTTALPCAICGLCFSDAFTLQKHWLSHVCDRPHVCKICDAGFTTAEALRAHSLTHQNIER